MNPRDLRYAQRKLAELLRLISGRLSCEAELDIAEAHEKMRVAHALRTR